MTKKLCYILILLCFLNSFAQVQEKPNVVFILADDLGINALHAYGNEFVESPNIDQLFAEGMHFTNGYSSDPTCAPSRASIMSGQYVPRHKVYRVADRYKDDPKTIKNMKFLPPQVNRTSDGKGLSPEKITIAEVLDQNGYRTAGFGKWHLGRKSMAMENQGFDEALEITGHYNFKIHSETTIEKPDSLYSSDFITEKGIDFMKASVEDQQPFFLYMPYYLVHKPLEPKPEYLQHFQKKYDGNKEISKEDLEVLAMIKSLDENVGQLIKAIQDLNIEKETIVIFVSDNGHYKTDGELFNKPYRGFKGQTFEGGIRVPYIFKWTGKIAENSKSEQPIIHVDLYPTIAGLTNSQLDEEYILDGENLSPILLGEAEETKREALIWEYTNYARYNENLDEFASSWVNVIQKDGFKMTEDVEKGKYQLYNLNKDRYENEEVSEKYPEKIEELKKALEDWKVDTQYEKPRLNKNYKNFKK